MKKFIYLFVLLLNMIKNSAIITDGNLKSGIGRYAWNLFKLGFFENFAHLSYNGKSDFDNHVFFLIIGE